MMFPYMTFPDDTEVTHSQIEADGKVKVYIETPIYGGFKNLTCILPDYKIKNNAHIIFEMAKDGGIMHATAV